MTKPVRPALGAWALARALLWRPARAAAALREEPGALSAAAWIYVVYLVVSVLFYSWKPPEFAAGGDGGVAAGVGALPQSPAFWAKVQAWNPILTGIWVVFLAWLAETLRGGKLVLRLLGGAALCVAIPAVALVLRAGGQAPRAALWAVTAAVLAALIPGLRRRDAAGWRRLVALTLALVVINLALLPLFVAAVAAGNESLYKGLELVMLLWTLALGTALLSRIEEMPAARAFSALLFSMGAQLVFVGILFFLGLVPKEILKALMTV